MGLIRIFAAAALLAALAFPASAGAAKRHAPTAKAKVVSPIDAATAIGLRHWGATPCNGQVKVTPKRAVPAGLDPSSDAWVTFDSALGANNLAAPAAGYTNCVISLAKWRWPTTASMTADWDMLCMTMVHELGHLLGRPHDDAPRSVMAPVFTDYSSEPAMCRAARPSRRNR